MSATSEGVKIPEGKLADFFAKINMTELPAMSSNVHELIALTQSSRTAAYELSKVILKDYSLTNKVLQVVNSAFYSLGRPVSSISRAVTVLGFDAVRDLAAAIAIFEDFIKAGVEKESISILLTKSFLSAVQARDLVTKKNFDVQPEEAFICALLHNLGKIVVCMYAPDMYRDIMKRISAGTDEVEAEKAVLDNYTFQQLGEEVGKFWFLSEKIINCMEKNPVIPENAGDSMRYLTNVSIFSNTLVDSICDGKDLTPLMEKFGDMMIIDKDEAIESVAMSVEASEDISDSLRYGLSKLKMRSKITAAEEALTGKPASEAKKEKKAKVEPDDEEEEKLTELPISKDKSVNDFIHDITETLMGPFDLNDFYVNLLEALYQGVGFDRVLLAIMDIKPGQSSVVGRFGLGDVSPEAVSNFRHVIDDKKYAIPLALKNNKDMAITPEKKNAFPEHLEPFVRKRTVYLFPICIDTKPIGIIYLDRKAGRPQLDQSRIKAVRLFRDFAVMAIRKITKKK